MLYYNEHKVAVQCPKLLFSGKNHYFYIHHKICLYNCNRICSLLFLSYPQHLRTFHDHCIHHHFCQWDISNILGPIHPHLDSMPLIRLRRWYPENCSRLSLAIPIIWPAAFILSVTLFDKYWFVRIRNIDDLWCHFYNNFESGHASNLRFQIPWTRFFWSWLKPFFNFIFIFF